MGDSFAGDGDKILLVGQSYDIWGNFSKICIKIIKNLKNYWENLRKMQFYPKNFQLSTKMWGK